MLVEMKQLVASSVYRLVNTIKVFNIHSLFVNDGNVSFNESISITMRITFRVLLLIKGWSIQ